MIEDFGERVTGHYPAPDMSASQFEDFLAELLSAAHPEVSDLVVTKHETIEAADGTYDMDATIRFNIMGMGYLTLVEAKKHNHPIKRELVQILHSKLQSIGAQKAVMFSTAPYQSGALKYAKQHGIALVKLTEGRFTFETRSADSGMVVTLTRDEARQFYDIPTYVGHSYAGDDTLGSISSTLISEEHPDYVAELLFGIAPRYQ